MQYTQRHFVKCYLHYKSQLLLSLLRLGLKNDYLMRSYLLSNIEAQGYHCFQWTLKQLLLKYRTYTLLYMEVSNSQTVAKWGFSIYRSCLTLYGHFFLSYHHTSVSFLPVCLQKGQRISMWWCRRLEVRRGKQWKWRGLCKLLASSYSQKFWSVLAKTLSSP